MQVCPQGSGANLGAPSLIHQICIFGVLLPLHRFFCGITFSAHAPGASFNVFACFFVMPGFAEGFVAPEPYKVAETHLSRNFLSPGWDPQERITAAEAQKHECPNEKYIFCLFGSLEVGSFCSVILVVLVVS